MSTPTTTEPVSYYPVMLDLRGRRCVVVGGGPVAEAKVAGLLGAGARVSLVAPEVSPTLAAWAAEGRIEWSSRPYRPGDLEGAFLAIAATDSSETNEAVWTEAERRAIPLNAVDDPSHCSVILPAIHRDGELVVTVSTGGRAPAVAARLRDRIAAQLGDGYGPYLDLLGSLRSEVAARHRTFEARRRIWYRIADSEALDRVRAGDLEGARLLALELAGGVKA